jgi:hypothetical protein
MTYNQSHYYQSLMLYRYLKYTPEHMHCHATFYGHQVPPNTGILAIQKISGNIPGFRIAATGVGRYLMSIKCCMAMHMFWCILQIPI